MICPECKIEMLVLEYLEIEIDFCGKCRGVWLDEGELELLLVGREKEISPVLDILDDAGKGGKRVDRRCPVCSRKMLETQIRLTPPVVIDKCPKNHGLWFDKGELEQVAAATSSGPVVDFLKSIFEK